MSASDNVFSYFRQLEITQKVDLAPPIPQRYWLNVADFISDVNDESGSGDTEMTYFLAIAILARYLATLPRTTIYEYNKTLANYFTAALIIAQKYENEPSAVPGVRRISRITAISKEELIKAEIAILDALEYNLSWITPFHFLDWFGLAIGDAYNPTTRATAIFLLSLGQANYHFLELAPSLQAATAIYLARYYHGIKDNWLPELEARSGYPLSTPELLAAVETLLRWVVAVSSYGDDIYLVKKFSSRRYYMVSKLIIDHHRKAG